MKTNRIPSIEEDRAAEARKKELIAKAKLKNAAPGLGQLAALADKWGTKLKKLCLFLPLALLFASCSHEPDAAQRMRIKNTQDSIAFDHKQREAARLTDRE